MSGYDAAAAAGNAPDSAADAAPDSAVGFAARLRGREPVVGYWIAMDSPVSTERIARLGYDYVCFDAQHGLLDYRGILTGLMAVQAAAGAVGLVRVAANDPTMIGQALDAGAAGVIVPLVDTAEQAAAAVQAAKYPPLGRRSYGPMRSGLRIGPDPAASNATTVVLAMIETPEGLANVEAICAVPGIDGIYVGPSDLRIAVGGASPSDSSVDEAFTAAVARCRTAAEAAGVCAGIHTFTGASAAAMLSDGYTLTTVSADLTHLEQIAREHLQVARGGSQEDGP